MMAFDGERVLVFGGTCAAIPALNDLWAWDGTTWTEPQILPFRASGMTWDPIRDRGLLFGGGRGASGTGFSSEVWELREKE